MTVWMGDCIELMADMPDATVDSIITDPPYGLGFMGKAWDDLPPGLPWAQECLRVLKPGGHLLAFGGTRTWHRLAVAVENAGFEIRDSIAWMYGSGFPKSLNLTNGDGERTGWGTALKPAFEPIVVARKPLVGTVAANVLAHGTGALNIDGCRVSYGADDLAARTSRTGGKVGTVYGATNDVRFGDGALVAPHASGRWPANVVLDESQAAALDAARFFYVAKASRHERPKVAGSAHPTVKPLALMRWLVRLATPPDGVVLDPFAGSGTTVEACILEGFDYIAIEREAEYLPLIMQRINRQAADLDTTLIDLLDDAS